MGILSFLGIYTKNSMNDVAKSVTSTIVAIDPEGASEAQLDMMLEKLSELSQKVAKYRRLYEKDLQETAEWKQKLNDTISALEVLEQDLASATGSNADKIGEAIDRLLDEVEKIEGEITREEQEDQEALEVLQAYEEAEKDLAEKIKIAKKQLESLNRNLETAQARKEMAEERLNAQKELDGLGSSVNALDIASQEMEKELNRLKEEEEALKSQTELLKGHTEEENDLISSALARAKGEEKSSSRADRLAKLKARRSQQA
jgi:chromosome segregation ATPase